jgi:hypothetical protein
VYCTRLRAHRQPPGSPGRPQSGYFDGGPLACTSYAPQAPEKMGCGQHQHLSTRTRELRAGGGLVSWVAAAAAAAAAAAVLAASWSGCCSAAAASVSCVAAGCWCVAVAAAVASASASAACLCCLPLLPLPLLPLPLLLLPLLLPLLLAAAYPSSCCRSFTAAPLALALLPCSCC